MTETWTTIAELLNFSAPSSTKRLHLTWALRCNGSKEKAKDEVATLSLNELVFYTATLVAAEIRKVAKKVAEQIYTRKLLLHHCFKLSSTRESCTVIFSADIAFSQCSFDTFHTKRIKFLVTFPSFTNHVLMRWLHQWSSS